MNIGQLWAKQTWAPQPRVAIQNTLEDSVQNIKLAKKSPKGAFIRSVAFPGWGQWYNGQKIKAFLAFSVEGFLIGLSIYYNRKAQQSEEGSQLEELWTDRRKALMAAGIMNSLGSIPAPRAAAPSIGMSRVVVAVLLVASVKKVTTRQIHNMSSNTCRVASEESRAPMVWLRPELVKASAIAIPAPNSINIPHGIVAAVSQSSSRSPLPSGIRNSAVTDTKATTKSLV